MQAMGYVAYFCEPAAGGYGYGKDNAERAAFTALGYNFLRRAIGWTPNRAREERARLSHDDFAASPPISSAAARPRRPVSSRIGKLFNFRRDIDRSGYSPAQCAEVRLLDALYDRISAFTQ